MLLPFRTDRPRIRPAYLTVTLIAVNTLIYALTAASMVQELSSAGVREGAVYVPWVYEQFALWGSHPTLLGFFTHMFLHADPFHLIGNMLFLWIFGSLIEDALRPLGFALLYLGGGFAAALAHLAISGILGHSVDGPMVGASGAIAAIMGLFMLRFYQTRVEVFYWFGWFYRGTFWVEAIWALGYWIVIEIGSGVFDAAFAHGRGGVAHWAHVGGFVAGAIAAPFIGSVQQAQREYITGDPQADVELLKRREQAEALERELKAEPGNAYRMRRLAQAYRRAQESGQALAMYQRCIGRFAERGMTEQAAEVYRELVELNAAAPLPADVLLPIARQLEATSAREAVSAYRRIAQQFTTRPEAEEALFRAAALYAKALDQPYEALSCLNETLQRYPHGRFAENARRAKAMLDSQVRIGNSPY
jgi:membrane associated rhomboid family serine protease